MTNNDIEAFITGRDVTCPTMTGVTGDIFIYGWFLALSKSKNSFSRNQHERRVHGVRGGLAREKLYAVKSA